MTTVPPEVQAYLKRLDRALRPVPRNVASDIRAGITEELAGLDSQDAVERVRSFDDPEAIAAAALGESRADAQQAPRRRAIWIVGAVAAVVVVALVVAASVSGWLSGPGPDREAQPAGPSASAFPMPDLGPSPAPATPGPDELEKLRLDEQDREWDAVTATYPDAVRPADPFQEYRDPNDSTALLGCLTAAGLPVDLGSTVGGGGPVSVGTSTSTEAEEVASFTCWAGYPTKPVAPMTAAQLDYLYSYLTEYLVPCYEANGITNEKAPSREDFVSQWPNQGWFPDTTSAALSDQEQQRIDSTCKRPD